MRKRSSSISKRKAESLKRNFNVNQKLPDKRKSDLSGANNALASNFPGLRDYVPPRDASPLPNLPNRLTPLITPGSSIKVKNTSKLDLINKYDSTKAETQRKLIAPTLSGNVVNDTKVEQICKKMLDERDVKMQALIDRSIYQVKESIKSI